MAHFHIKTKKGRPYLYVREIARVDGKPKVISQIYIGSLEKVAGLLGGKDSDILNLKVEEFGSLWLAHQIDREIDLCGIVDSVVPRAEGETGSSVGEYFLYCVLNRMVQAVSKNKLADWFRKTSILPGLTSIPGFISSPPIRHTLPRTWRQPRWIALNQPIRQGIAGISKEGREDEVRSPTGPRASTGARSEP